MNIHSVKIVEFMIEKVELGSVNSKNTPNNRVGLRQKDNTQFTGLGSYALKAVQKCEEYPMLNVTVLDLSTAILPRTFFETFIGSKKKDENGNEQKERKLNIFGGFEAFRRESSGLLINCIIPSFIVEAAAFLLQKPIMGLFSKSSLYRSWANSDSISQVHKFYKAAEGANHEEKIFNTLKNMFDSIEGVDGDVDKGGMKKFRDIFANDEEYINKLKQTAKDIAAGGEKSKSGLYKYMVGKSGIAENIRFIDNTSTGKSKGFFSSSLGHLCESAEDILRGIVSEGDKIISHDDLAKYCSKAKHLVNAKSIAGLGLIIPLALSAQPINRWITHHLSGKKGAPIYNDDQDRVLTPEEKTKLTAQKFFAVPLMLGVAGLSMIMDRPSLKMFQFKNIFPTMDQARIISAATFSSRIAASEDSNELKENTIRDIATFSSFYFLGDYAAKGIATLLEHKNKDGIKFLNRLKNVDENANIFKKFWNWAKHTKMKSTDELGAIADKTLRTKAKNMRAFCQIGNLVFSLISLGVFIPLYTRTQTNKKQQLKAEQEAKLAAKTPQTNAATTFTQKFINGSPAFNSFFNS